LTSGPRRTHGYVDLFFSDRSDSLIVVVLCLSFVVADLYNVGAFSRSTIAAEDYISTLINRAPMSGFSAFSEQLRWAIYLSGLNKSESADYSLAAPTYNMQVRS
jgi:hypothetical protein